MAEPASAGKPSPSKDNELRDVRAQLAEASAQQAATSEVLRLIASSIGDLQSVLDRVAEIALRLFDASDVRIRRLEERHATCRRQGRWRRTRDVRAEIPLDSDSIAGRLASERQTIHIHDLSAVREEFPVAGGIVDHSDIRTIAGTPLLANGSVIGTIMVRRSGVRPFSDSQIALLETFADQAVIAIENARLFREARGARSGPHRVARAANCDEQFPAIRR